jgi:hypothetical protein
MTPLRQTNFRLEEELLDALQQIKEQTGIPVSEQVRRALQAWIALRAETGPKPKRPSRRGNRKSNG